MAANLLAVQDKPLTYQHQVSVSGLNFGDMLNYFAYSVLNEETGNRE